MTTDNGEDAWAQLVSLTDLDTAPVPLKGNKFVIGRNNDCDIAHTGNKLVSGKHCYIEKDDQGKVWLYDTSTNGTLLNMSLKLCKGECRELHHGDEIHIVHKKDNTDDDIGYMYQDMEALQAETSSDLEETEDYTQVMVDPDSTLPDEDLNAVESPSPPRKRKSKEDVPIDNKKAKTDSEVSSSTATDEGNAKDETTSDIGTKKEETEEHKKSVGGPVGKLNEASKMTTIRDATTSESTENTTKLQGPDDDAIAETLICIICQELLYDCISLQPCMHSFCAGCYSAWMEKSSECPSCRLKVERINKNHIVNNLVEAYLKLHPEKKRPDADLEELNAKNKITRDMLYPGKKRRSSDSGEGSDQSDYSDDDDEEEEGENPTAPLPVFNFNNTYNPGGHVFGIGTPFFGTMINRAAQPVCRQCPQYKDPPGAPNWKDVIKGAVTAVKNAITGGVGGASTSTAAPTTTDTGAIAATADTATPGPSTAAGPSTAGATPVDSDAKTYPEVPNFTCAINANHVLCLCCMQPMPDRRNQFHSAGGTVPPQQCYICYRAFCHAYWGCLKLDCNGCLAKFKDLNFGKKCLTSLILDNAYESEVFKNYMEKKGLSVKGVFAECVAKMVTGEYLCTDRIKLNNQQGMNTPVCYACGLRSFKEMVYYYRASIPNEELPKEVTSRPNCYWGKNCRTQRNKPDHAKRFNHICDQTRTM